MKRVKLLTPHFIDGEVRRGVVVVPDDFRSEHAVEVPEEKAAEAPPPEPPPAPNPNDEPKPPPAG